MKTLILGTVWQFALLLFLFAKDKNDGHKNLFKLQAWSASDVFFTVILVNFLAYFEYAVEYFLLQSYSIDWSLLRVHPYVFHVLLFLVLITLFKFRFKKNLSALGYGTGNRAKIIGVGMLAAFCNYSVLIALRLAIGGTSGPVEIAGNFGTILDAGVFVFMTVLAGPAIEEAICRGIFYSPYRKKYGPGTAILLTALLFSALHYKAPSFSVVACGVCYGIVYEKTESILASIIAHGATNALILAAPLKFLVIS